MNKYFAYTRVSTQKQGVQGVSLQEQRAAIDRYAQNHNLNIVEWLEERDTAAKQGRPVFIQMVKRLHAGKAKGVIFHKVDRGSRNHHDWAAIGDLIDAGISVHFANSNLDLTSRGGRLTADIEAVMAADYIRNLREEVVKGMRGRLKQGIWPTGAPLGYLDMGGGKLKAIDPTRGPLIREAFELYATGNYSLRSLCAELGRRGLTTRAGTALKWNGLSSILNNPFYIGILRVRKTGERFIGKHTPLISVSLFNQVQSRLSGQSQIRKRIHDCLLRGLFTCKHCKRLLKGELQKGHYYYRCQSKGCPTKGFREECLEAAVLAALPVIPLNDELKQRLAEDFAIGRAARKVIHSPLRK